MKDTDPPRCPFCKAALKKFAERVNESKPIGTDFFAYKCPDCTTLWFDWLDGEPLRTKAPPP